MDDNGLITEGEIKQRIFSIVVGHPLLTRPRIATVYLCDRQYALLVLETQLDQDLEVLG